jgi:hypothetical protein
MGRARRTNDGGELGRLRRRWVDNIKLDLRQIGIKWDGVDWIDMARDRD